MVPGVKSPVAGGTREGCRGEVKEPEERKEQTNQRMWQEKEDLVSGSGSAGKKHTASQGKKSKSSGSRSPGLQSKLMLLLCVLGLITALLSASGHCIASRSRL
jgi:hypothetical protein